MSMTYTIDHVVASVEDVSVEVAAKSEMSFAGIETDPKTGQRTATYNLASGDNAYPASVVFRTAVQKAATGMIRRFGWSFNTWAVVTDSVSGIATRKPLQVNVSIVAPADYTVEVADLDAALGNAYSFSYPSVTTKVRSTSWLAKLLFGVAQVA